MSALPTGQLDPNENEHSVGIRPDGVIVVRMRGHIDDAAFNTFCDRMEEIYEPLCTPFSIVIDASALAFISAPRRKRLADMDKKYRDKDRKYNRGQAFVVRSRAIRGALTAIQWLSRPVYPSAVFETFEQGLAWAMEKLK